MPITNTPTNSGQPNAHISPARSLPPQAGPSTRPTSARGSGTTKITMEVLETKFRMGETLGTGAFSEVKCATERATGQKYAIKIIDRNKCKGKESMIETEVRILQQVKHENIIQLYEMYEIENKIYLVMELVTGGELFDDIVNRGKYTEGDAARIVHKILLAIEYLHSKGIVHRDLKPENLLLSDRSPQAKIMISDFGLSKIFDDDEVMRTACGTPGYVAPEVLQRTGYGKEIDLWSLGVITYILLCGYPPFYDTNNVKLFKQIMAGEYEFDKPWWDPISDKAKNFIRHLLVLSAGVRYTARQALNHPFLVDNCGASPELAIIEPRAEKNPVEAAPAKSTAPKSTTPGTTEATQKPSEQQSNIAPQVQANLQRVYSTKHSFKGVSEPDAPIPRPIGAKGPADDSVIVTSHESVAKRDDSRPKGKERKIIAAIATSGVNNRGGKGSPKATSPGQSTSNPGSSSATPESSGGSINEQSMAESGTLPQLRFPPVVGLPGTPQHVRLLTYDLMCRPPGVKNNINDFKNARLVSFGENMLKHFDVVAVQELFAYGSSRQGKLVALAKRAGMDYFVCSPAKGLLNTMVVDAGLMILSRYPIVKSEKITFKQRGINNDRFVARGAIYAKIALSPTQFIHVFNTHLQTSTDRTPTMTDPTLAVRVNQLVALKEFIDACVKRKAPHEQIILLGNLNINARKNVDTGNRSSDEYLLLNRILKGEVTAVVHYPQHNSPAQSPTSPQSPSNAKPGSSPNPSTSPTSSSNGPPIVHEPLRLQVQDMILESYGEHPITLGDVTGFPQMAPAETILTQVDHQRTCQCVDYALWMNAESQSVDSGGVQMEPASTRIEKFLVDGEPFTQLSDHYGVSMSIQVKQPPQIHN